MLRALALAFFTALLAAASPAAAALDPTLAAEGWRALPNPGRAPLALARDGETGLSITGALSLIHISEPTRH